MDLTTIPWLPGAGIGTVVALALIAVLRGLLVPRWTVDKWLAMKDERIADKAAQVEEYKAAWQTAEAAREAQGEQQRELLEYARTTDQIIRALRRAGTSGRGEGPA